MLVGVPREIKNNEYRVGLTPSGARELMSHGHQVLIEQNAGAAIGLADDDYARAGAMLIKSAQEIYARAELIIKVKEPQAQECAWLCADQTLFTYLHLAADAELTQRLLDSGVTGIAYETVTDARGALPLLAPMSEVAGRMAMQAAAHHLEKAQGGRGVLLGGVPGVAPAQVVVLGGGVVGLNAARIALGMGAKVTIVDKSLPRLQQLDDMYGPRLTTIYSSRDAIERLLPHADVVVGAALIPGAAAPKLITREMLALMQPGSVLVDVAIDQGGCFETSKPTTHQNPTFIVDNIIHYCVANMPGALARTATFALTNATLPYVLKLANQGVRSALQGDPGFRNGLNLRNGHVTFKAVADLFGHVYRTADVALAS
ncbi:MAG TPA: alanine dehydrogenase [Spongiibacteraceae bacterium]|nr:alanine dehydrogenase [Spongiibacteraceae bacterium]